MLAKPLAVTSASLLYNLHILIVRIPLGKLSCWLSSHNRAERDCGSLSLFVILIMTRFSLWHHSRLSWPHPALRTNVWTPYRTSYINISWMTFRHGCCWAPFLILNQQCQSNQAYSEYKHLLTFCVPPALCCHSNKTCAPIANPPNCAQLQGTPYHSPTYIQVSAVVWECGVGQTRRQTHRRPWPIYITPRIRLSEM